MRLGVPLVVVATALPLAACSQGLPEPGGGSDAIEHIANPVSATITGQISTDGHTVYPNGGFIDQKASLQWTIRWTADLINNTVTHRYGFEHPRWTIDRMLGSVSWAGTGGLSCSGTLTAVDGAASRDLSDFLTVSGTSSNVPFSQEQYLVKAGVPDKSILVSSDTNPQDAQCNTEIAVDFLQNGPTQGDASVKWNKIVRPEEAFPGTGGSVPLSFDYSGPVPDSPPGQTVTVTDHATETITFDGPSSGK